MIYCGIHQADHTVAEFAACLASLASTAQPVSEDDE